jgi:hypothetical protein
VVADYTGAGQKDLGTGFGDRFTGHQGRSGSFEKECNKERKRRRCKKNEAASSSPAIVRWSPKMVRTAMKKGLLQ